MLKSDASIRAVLDTNVWISGIFFGRGIPAELLQKWRDGRYEIFMTVATLAELENVLQRKVAQFAAPPALATEWIKYIETYSTFVDATAHYGGTSRDAKDDMMLEAAIAGQVQYLVTGDNDLLVIGQIGDVAIIKPRQFLDILDANE